MNENALHLLYGFLKSQQFSDAVEFNLLGCLCDLKMHGRPRKAPTREDEAGSAGKGKKLGFLQSQLLYNHHKKIYNEEALDLSAKTLQTNPDLYTALNYRKLAVQHKLAASHPDFNSIFDPELRLVEIALGTNPKAYRAWYHREWTTNNYGAFLATLFNTSDHEELKFTNKMIQDNQDNLSNYSMWQHHSKIGILTLARLLTAINVLLSRFTNKTVDYKEVLELYKDLMKMDPLHSPYYKDQHSLVFLQEVTSNRESLQ
ncbi:unnamed protein product [Prunus armeniaca]